MKTEASTGQFFKVGDRVIDRDGFNGIVREVTTHDGHCWYDVQFGSSWAVRYDADLQHARHQAEAR